MDFYLLETLYYSPETGLRFFDRHLRRLSASAQHLGFACHQERIRNDTWAYQANLPAGPHRLRITLERSGHFTISAYPLAPPPVSPVSLLFAPEWGFASQQSSNPLLLHKTSIRDEYDRAWKLAEDQRAFDMLFTNERGELTEGGRTNLFLRIENRWWTPPLSCGVLPGVMRSVLLEDNLFGAGERALSSQDLLRADQILLCNSVRGSLKATLQVPPHRCVKTKIAS